MSRTDDILDKTKRKEPEAKKWKVVVGIVVGLVLGGILFGSCYVMTEPVADSYLQQSKPLLKHSAFYNNQIGKDEQSVYFIGSSVIGTAVYCPLIDSILQEQGYNIETYNSHLGADRPRIRVMEIDDIIESNPDLVIYGMTYTNMVGADIEPTYIMFSPNPPLFNQDLSDFFTDDELIGMLEYSLFPKRGYIIDGISPYFTSVFGIENHDDKLRYFMKEGYSPESLMIYEKEHYNVENIRKTADNTYSHLDFTKDAAINNADALVYSIQRLKDAGIPVILINMPIHPIVSDAIPQDARQDYYDILNRTGVEWIDAERYLNDEDMYDHFHKTWGGCQKFSEMMADLIIQELS